MIHHSMTADIVMGIKDEKAIAEFEAVKAYYKKMNGYYGKVKAWFLKNYKDYQDVDFSKLAEEKKPEDQAPATEETTELANVA